MMFRLFILCVISTCIPALVGSDCNCEEGCARNSLERCKSCLAGWYGPYCQKKNVALNGIAKQQGTWEGLDASFAVDGNINIKQEPRNCAHTDGEENSWWSVQLGDNGVNQIRYMKIYHREELTESKQYNTVREWNIYECTFSPNRDLWRRKGMEILIDGKRCKKWEDYEIPEIIENVNCKETLTGHNLTITVLGPYYSVCEVQLFVCSDGWFGEDCDKRCNCRFSNDICDKVSRSCNLGCQAGYAGCGCQTMCKDGRFGQDCYNRCGHCANNGSCDKITGHCPFGCEVGWEEQRCDRDSSTKWGRNVPDSSIKWHVLPMALSALGTCLFVLLVYSGFKQGRLMCVRNSTEEPSQMSHDHVRMSDVARQPEHIYEAPIRSSNTVAENNHYAVIQPKVYENI